MDEEVLDVADAAKMLGLSVVTVRKHAHEFGKKIGKQWRFTRSGIAGYINQASPSIEAINTDARRTAGASGTAISASRSSGVSTDGGGAWGRRSKAARETTNAVEQAIAHVGSPSELARRLSEITGKEVSRQCVNGWRQRGNFPRDMLVSISKLCPIPLEVLASAKTVDPDSDNIVNRAIRKLGNSATAETLADELSKHTPKPITRQMVNGWQIRKQFPIPITPWVHLITKIPMSQLVKRNAGAERK